MLPQPLCCDAAGAAACCAKPGPAPLAPLRPGGISSSLGSAWCLYEAKEAKSSRGGLKLCTPKPPGAFGVGEDEAKV